MTNRLFPTQAKDGTWFDEETGEALVSVTGGLLGTLMALKDASEQRAGWNARVGQLTAIALKMGGEEITRGILAGRDGWHRHPNPPTYPYNPEPLHKLAVAHELPPAWSDVIETINAFKADALAVKRDEAAAGNSELKVLMDVIDANRRKVDNGYHIRFDKGLKDVRLER